MNRFGNPENYLFSLSIFFRIKVSKKIVNLILKTEALLTAEHAHIAWSAECERAFNKLHITGFTILG